MTDIQKVAFQIKSVREAGAVRRCHILPHKGEHTIGSHSFGALSLLLILNPSPSLGLVKAVLWHDVAERWVGDMPATTKSVFPGLGHLYEQCEAEIIKKLDLFPALHFMEQAWLKSVDTLDLMLWALEEYNNGNADVLPVYDKCYTSLWQRKKGGMLPPEVEVYMERFDNPPRPGSHERLNDLWDVALTDGLG